MTQTRTHDTSWKNISRTSQLLTSQRIMWLFGRKLFHWNQEVSIFGRKWLYCNLQMYKHVQPKVTFKHQHIEHEETTALSPTLIQPMNVQTKCSIKDHLHTPANRSWTNDDTFTTSSSIVPQTSPINQRPIWHKPSATARFYEIIFMEYPGLRYAD